MKKHKINREFHFSETYAEITNLLQGYIDNEVNLNPDGSCTNTCYDYDVTENYGCKNYTYCRLNYLDYNKTRCYGTVRDCQYIESSMHVCPNVGVKSKLGLLKINLLKSLTFSGR